MTNKKLVPALGISVLLLAACSDQVPEIPSSELYTRAFVKEFGVVDGAQDWNNATRGSVNVSVDASAEVQVTAKIGRSTYLLAHYTDFSGSREITFDVPKGVNEVTVRCGRERATAKLGGKVAFAGIGRAIWDMNQDPNEVVSVSRTDDYRELSDVAVRSFGAKLKEGDNNLNLEGVVQNFEFVANGPFTVYPVFWKTSAYNTLGIYYIRKDESTGKEYMVHVPFYTHKIAPIDGTKGNILYLPSECRTPGLEGHWCDPKQEGGGKIISNPGSYNNTGKTSFEDFDDEDWAYFMDVLLRTGQEYSTRITLNSVQNDFDLSVFNAWIAKYGYSYWDKGVIDDVEYTVQDEKNVKVTKIHVATIEDEVDKSDESKWIYPGSSDPTQEAQQCSYPDYDSYVSYLRQGLTDDDIISKGFKFPALWRSRGINIDIAEGTHFGMYIRKQDWKAGGEGLPSKDNIETIIELEIGEDGKPMNPQYTRYYSNSFYNNKDMTDPDGGTEMLQAVHAATYMYTAPSGIDYRVLGFEDWEGDRSDRDLNDMIFFIGSADPSKIPDVEDEDKPKPIRWLIACEDLGAMDDFDFNDVVFEVEHVAGETTATITPLAAGGTLETYLFCGDRRVGGEWHANFGGAPFTQMINTTTISHTAAPITITVPADFSIASSLEGDGEDAYRDNMGGFYLEVTRTDGKVAKITAPGAGDAPQMFLVFQAEGKPWQWPIERHHISHAYPAFIEWMSGGTYEVVRDGANWFDTPVSSHTIAR